jgi:phosphate transport system substrate-binding protein
VTKKLLSGVAIALALTIALAACGSSSSSSSSSSGTLTGAGSTLVAPLMSKWQSDFASQPGGFTVTYGAIGSGGGIDDITGRSVDFGASDAPLTPDQFSAAKGVEQIPWALTGTVPAYNVSGAPKNLKITGPVLADMFLGKITAWNDPAIAKLNPGANLPSTKITPVYRSDGSGTTYSFVNYLSSVSPEFKSKVGVSTSVKFPTGTGAEHNDGVAAAISQTDGAIGYVGLDYALENSINVMLVQNSAGSYPTPGLDSVAAAADAVSKVNSDNSIPLINLPKSAKDAYPISTYTYVIVPLKTDKASELQKFISYAISKTGQAFGPDLDFPKIPSQVVAADQKAVGKIGS